MKETFTIDSRRKSTPAYSFYSPTELDTGRTPLKASYNIIILFSLKWERSQKHHTLREPTEMFITKHNRARAIIATIVLYLMWSCKSGHV